MWSRSRTSSCEDAGEQLVHVPVDQRGSALCCSLQSIFARGDRRDIPQRPRWASRIVAFDLWEPLTMPLYCSDLLQARSNLTDQVEQRGQRAHDSNFLRWRCLSWLANVDHFVLIAPSRLARTEFEKEEKFRYRPFVCSVTENEMCLAIGSHG